MDVTRACRQTANAASAAALTIGRELVAGAAGAFNLPTGPVGPVSLHLLVSQLTGESHQPPVVLVHGYASHRSVWLPLAHRLRERGIGNVWALSYQSVGPDIPQLAAGLAACLGDLRRSSAGDRVHLVGHSLGGLVLRFALQELAQEANVLSATTIATPHYGAPLARLAFGGLGADLRPRSGVLRQLAEPRVPSALPWVSYYSRSDALVRPASARLPTAGLAVSNVHISACGHLSILRSTALADDLAARLMSASRPVVTRAAGRRAALEAA